MEEKANPRNMRFAREFQQAVIRLMLMDASFCHKAVDLLQASHFVDRLSWFFSTIAEFTKEHGTMPTPEVIFGEISKHSVDKQIEYSDELTEILKIQPVPNHIKDRMTDFVRCNIFIQSAHGAAKLYNNNKQNEAFTFVKEKMEELYKSSFESDPYSRFGDARSVIAQAYAEQSAAIKTGIKLIDEQIGGLLPGTFTVWLGASNAGKSMLGPALAKQAAKQGKRTFISIHEDEETPTKIRYLACFAEIDINKLTFSPYSLTEDELARLDKADKLLKEFVTLRFMYTTEATIENVMDVARDLMRTWPFDLYVCDYGQCLTSKLAGRQEMRHLNEHVYHMLKQLCLELKIAGTGGAQVNRNGMAMNRAGSEFLRCTDVSEAYGIIKKATSVITMNRSNEDVINNRIVFLLDKARNGKCPVAVECMSDYGKAIVYRVDSQQNPVSVAGGPSAMDTDDEDIIKPKQKQTYG
jgi:replicative DNA helicase